MREILFRGKRTDNGEWVEGDLSQHKTGKVFIKSGSAIHSYEVISETVGQYTGLTDKKGNKIFEGDILKFLGANLYKVYFDKAEARFQMTGYNDEYEFYKCAHFCEVIGSVYDKCR